MDLTHELLFFVFVYTLSELKKFMKKRKLGLTGNEVKPRWELDYDLLENEGLFGEYLEMGKRLHRMVSGVCSRSNASTSASSIRRRSNFNFVRTNAANDQHVTESAYVYVSQGRLPRIVGSISIIQLKHS